MAEMGKKENLSIRGLAPLIGKSSIRAEVERLVAEAVENGAFARDWRHRHIAHRDRALALDDNATALAFASRATVEAAIASLVTLVEVVHERLLDGAVSREIPGSPGDALDLLRVLQEGVAADRAREERFRTGTVREDDLTPRPAI